MDTKLSHAPASIATRAAEVDTPALPIDPEMFARAWHAEHVHTVEGGDPGCVLCGPLKSTYLLPTCRCGAALQGEGCPCEQDDADVAELFVKPIRWDLRGEVAA